MRWAHLLAQRRRARYGTHKHAGLADLPWRQHCGCASNTTQKGNMFQSISTNLNALPAHPNRADDINYHGCQLSSFTRSDSLTHSYPCRRERFMRAPGPTASPAAQGQVWHKPPCRVGGPSLAAALRICIQHCPRTALLV